MIEDWLFNLLVQNKMTFENASSLLAENINLINKDDKSKEEDG